MGHSLSDEPPDPTGREFLRVLLEHEDRFEARFGTWISTESPANSPDLLDSLGDVLLFLDRMASCHWGCTVRDHPERHVASSAYSSAKASLRLLRGGYMAEAIATIRTLGEAANLMYLLGESEQERTKFRNASARSREKHFGAGVVRRKLEGLGKGMVLAQQPYQAVSRSMVHPSTVPASMTHHVLWSSTLSEDSGEREAALKALYTTGSLLCTVLLAGMRLFDRPPHDQAALQAAARLQAALDSRMVVLMEE